MYKISTKGIAANFNTAMSIAETIRKINLVLLSTQLIEPNLSEKILISLTNNQHMSTVMEMSNKVELIKAG